MTVTAPVPQGRARIFARVISILFLPVLWPALLFSLLFSSVPSLILTWTFLFVLPLGLSFLYFRSRKVDDIWVIQRRDRIIPFLINIACILLYFLLLHFALEIGFSWKLFMVLPLFNVVSLAITLYWKISLHMIGVLAAAGYVLRLAPENGGLILVSLGAVCLLVAWARWFLGSHDIYQILAGSLLGLSLGYLLSDFAFY